jgi:sulfur-oxidizing protein SoxA
LRLGPLLAGFIALAADGAEPPKSGREFLPQDLRALEDDDFANPGMLWIEKGKALWQTRAGNVGRSCADCHGDPSSTQGAGTAYPKFDPDLGRPVNLEQRIQSCRTRRQGAPPLSYESDELLALTAFVRRQSHGMPVTVDVDGPMAPFLERGRAIFETRRGQLDLACRHCHELNVGKRLREEVVSQGQSNGFPAYRMTWQNLGSLHRRFQACNAAVGAEPSPLGDIDYVALEVYLAVRGRGLPVETPAVRR